MPKIEIENYKTNVPAALNTMEVRPQDVGFNAGAVLEDIGKQQAKREERDAATYAVGQFSDFQLNELQALQQAKESGAPNSTQTYLEGYDTRLGNYLKTAPNELSAALLQKRASDWKDVVAGKAIEFEVTQRQAQALQTLDSAKNNYQQIVGQDPTQLPVVLRQARGDIDAMVATGRLTPLAGDARKTALEKDLGENAIYPGLQSENLAVVEATLNEIKSGQWDGVYRDNPKQKTTDINFAEARINDIRERGANLEAVRKTLGRPLNATMKLMEDDISLKDINELENAQDIDPKQADFLRSALAKNDIDPKVGDTTAANTVYVDLVNRFSEIQDSDDPRSPENIDAMAKWNIDVQKALGERDVGKGAMKNYVKDMQKLYLRAIDKDTPTRTFMGMEWNKNPNKGIQALKLWADNTKEFSGNDSKALIYQEYARLRSERGIDDMKDGAGKETAIAKAINDTKQSFLTKKDPSLMGYTPDNKPNSVISNGRKVQLDPNPSTAKAQSNVSIPPGTRWDKAGNPLYPVTGKPGTFLYQGREVMLK